MCGGMEGVRKEGKDGDRDGLAGSRHPLGVFWATSNQRVCPPRATGSLDEDSLASKAIDQYLKDSLPPHPSHIKQSTGFGTVVFYPFPVTQFSYNLLTLSNTA